jgi:hypothetical protein
LKLDVFECVAYCGIVAPFTGAWIETRSK